uniref:Triacylglycerol lipase n=1 Tax=Parascaris univalens TaxID=6257 RepID=A0A915BRR4_PARUN
LWRMPRARCQLLLLFVPYAFAIFSDDFNAWLVKNFGADVQAQLNRADLDTMGSFGGKTEPTEQVQKDPVVFVHGVSDRAWDKPKTYSHQWSELYGTTYANGSQNNPLQWAQYAMQCKYVKQVRMLIVAVHYYTARPVNLVAFSLGVPISRKAILGGRCVETGEDLGEPLTPFMETFVGVSGPNHGIRFEKGFSFCSILSMPICHKKVGVNVKECPEETDFLKDINSKVGYEGKVVFTIASKADAVVPYLVCGKRTAKIEGQIGEKLYENKTHDETYVDSYEVIRQMVLNHVVV